MPSIFLNLPVKDLNASIAFYKGLGFSNDPNFTDSSGAMISIDENIKVMLLTHEFYQTFIGQKTIADSTQSSECLIALSADSKAAVDIFVDTAIALGANEHILPENGLEYMYGRDFEDLDGHIWEIIWMDYEEYLKAQAIT